MHYDRRSLMKSLVRHFYLLVTLVPLVALAQLPTKPIDSPTRIESKAIENFFQLSSNVFSGSTPTDTNAFALLRERGIKTIISVDGAMPDVDTAQQFGIRYVHLPMGYGRASNEQALRLAKAGEVLPKPIFIHCHHGKHRGPTAAAIVCMGSEGWTKERAKEWMTTAGTSADYAGLYQSIESAARISPETLKNVTGAFSEKAEIPPLVDAMVMIDEHLDYLKLSSRADFKELPEHPDITPSQEAMLLAESFREILRAPEMKSRNKEFVSAMQEATKLAGALHFCLSDSDGNMEKATKALQELQSSCTACHKAHRN